MWNQQTKSSYMTLIPLLSQVPLMTPGLDHEEENELVEEEEEEVEDEINAV